MKYLSSIILGFLLLVPSFSFAATTDEQQHALLLQLITLIEQEITSLQTQLASQQANASSTPVLGATEASQIQTITQQLAMPDETPFDYFFGAVQKTNALPYVQVVTNQPISIQGNIESSTEITGDTVFRNTKDKAYTYLIVLQGDSADITLIPSVGDSITKSVSL